ncbi:MAG: c-type cytochrome [Bdellovibrionales bacterium]
MRTIFFLITAFAIQLNAGEARQKAAACVACHGEAGISVNNLWPNLAGQKEDYLVKQLKAYREGIRADPLMSPFSKTLSEEDIKILAAYFANLKGAP